MTKLEIKNVLKTNKEIENYLLDELAREESIRIEMLVAEVELEIEMNGFICISNPEEETLFEEMLKANELINTDLQEILEEILDDKFIETYDSEKELSYYSNQQFQSVAELHEAFGIEYN